MITRKAVVAAAAVLVAGVYTAVAQSPAANMSFFVTSSNPKGGNLGGLTGADAVCQSLAQAAGAGRKNLACVPEHEHGRREDPDRQRSLVQLQGRADRAERGGPAHRGKNKMSANHVAHREGHDCRTTLRSTRRVSRPAAQPLQHDILTGSNEDGTKNADTCKDWTVGRRQRQGDARPRGSSGPQPRRELVERDPRLAGLRPGTASADRRRRIAVLLRDQLMAVSAGG